MPFHLPFSFPYGYNCYNYRRPLNIAGPQKKNFNYNTFCAKPEQKNNIQKNLEFASNEKVSNDSDYFFEIFGLKLYFDDVLIICILFFLYTEEVHDEELFLCLILLLIS